MFKYADDSYLLVPASAANTIPTELDNISRWADENNLKLNLSKSKEMIIHKKSSVNFPKSCPALQANVSRVKSLTILGINISDTLSLDDHIASLATAANSSMFALKTLKRMGLNSDALWIVCRATMISKLVYGSPAWRGFATQGQLDRLEAVIRRAKRCNVYPDNGSTITGIMDEADNKLFSKVLTNNNHVLSRLLPPEKEITYSLRVRAHNRILPKKSTLSFKNFFPRLLYQDIY
jgi:hypothetical protein